MTSMVEKVAEAIYRRGSTHLKPWEEADDGFKDFYRELARAAIEAMRDPIPAMMGAVVNQPAGDRYYSVRELEWRAAIDAALAESKEG